jgi:hypothetical protein
LLSCSVMVPSKSVKKMNFVSISIPSFGTSR